MPAELSSFIGRTKDLHALHRLLLQPTVRLLTVVGAGGVGKTRLVLQAVRSIENRLGRFNAVYFVPLGAVSQAEMVQVAIGQVIGVRDGGRIPLQDGIALALSGREALLILDTFEHVLPAHQVVLDLLARCPSLQILVTSRSPLRIPGEHLYRLQPMPVENDNGTGMGDAVTLLVERATALHEDFEVTTHNQGLLIEICVRLDGLPLAIELAAARLSVLPPAALLERLDRRLPMLNRAPRGVPARQRTQRATVAWSYDLLEPDEQAVFRQLAVCADGFSLSVAEEVLKDLDNIDALDMLERLVDASLVQLHLQGDETRYWLLDTVREYGLEIIEVASDLESLRRIHARAILRWMKTAEPHLYQRKHQLRWVRIVEDELENVRLALAWHEQHDAVGLAGLSNALGQFWLRRSMLEEGRDWATRTLAAIDETPSAMRVLGLIDLGRMLMYQLDDEDEHVQRTANVMAAGLKDPALQIRVLIGQLTRSLIRQDGRASIRVMRQIDAMLCDVSATESTYVQSTVYALKALAVAHLGQGDQVETLVTACLELGPKTHDADAFVAICRRAQAITALARKDVSAALALYQDALSQYFTFGERWTCAVVLLEIADLIEPVGPTATAWLVGAVDREIRLLGLRHPFASHQKHRLVRERANRRIGNGVWQECYAQGLQSSMSVAVERALRLEWVEAPVSTTPTGDELTPRELAVLRYIVDGLSDREIAAALGIQYRTTTTFVTRILTKLNVPSRTAAATTAIRLGLLPES